VGKSVKACATELLLWQELETGLLYKTGIQLAWLIVEGEARRPPCLPPVQKKKKKEKEKEKRFKDCYKS